MRVSAFPVQSVNIGITEVLYPVQYQFLGMSVIISRMLKVLMEYGQGYFCGIF